MAPTRVGWILGGVFSGIGAVFVIIAWIFIGLQQYKLATYLPAPAQITDSFVKTNRSFDEHHHEQVTYEPMITYRYQVAGRSYTSTGVMAMGNFAQSGDWASETCARYAVGTQTTAWYSPWDPGNAFLIHEVHWIPYLMALIASLFLSVGVWILYLRIRAERKLRPPVPLSDGWFDLAVETSLSDKIRVILFFWLAWTAYCLVVVSDYYLASGRHFDTFCTIVVASVAGVGLIPLYAVGRYWRLQHDFSDASVSVNRPRIRTGDKFRVRLRQTLLKPLQIKEVAAGAICMRDDRTRYADENRYTTEEDWSSWQPILTDKTFDAAGQIDGEVELVIPPEANTSSVSRSYPYFQWFIGLRIKAEGQPKLNIRYPVVVEDAETPPTG